MEDWIISALYFPASLIHAYVAWFRFWRDYPAPSRVALWLALPWVAKRYGRRVRLFEEVLHWNGRHWQPMNLVTGSKNKLTFGTWLNECTAYVDSEQVDSISRKRHNRRKRWTTK